MNQVFDMLRWIDVSNPVWQIAGSLIVGFIALEAERRWTRSLRRKGIRSSLMSRLLNSATILTWGLALVVGMRAFVVPFAGALSPAFYAPLIWLLGLVLLLVVGLALVQRIARSFSVNAASAGIAPARSTPVPATGTLAHYPAHQPAVFPISPAPLTTRPVQAAAPPAESMRDMDTRALIRARLEAQLQQRRAPLETTQRQLRWVLGALALALMICLTVVIIGRGWPILDESVSNSAPVMEQSSQSSQSSQSASTPASIEKNPASLRVRASQLPVRASPGANQPVIQTLSAGTQVQVLPDQRLIRDNIWVKIRVGLIEGWVSRNALE